MSNVLIGTAIGDALGVFAESKDSEYEPLLKWDGKSFIGSEYHKLNPGQWSDDTQFSICVAQSLIENDGFNPDDLSKRYVDLFTTNTIRGYGRTTKIAIDRLLDGEHWSKSGVEGSFGNGTAMRAAPFGVYFRNSIKDLVQAIKIDSSITHKSDEAEAGALAIALASFYLINGESDMIQILKQIISYIPPSQIQRVLAVMPDIVDSDISPAGILKILGTKARVQETVPAALYCLFKFSSFKDAVVTAIRAGGDTDTTAAIVGALFGVKDGLIGIDKQFHCVEDFDKLLNLDSQLFSRNSDNLFPISA